MNRILVLTKNVLSEIELQGTLQRLGYEVLVSSVLYTQLSYGMPSQKELSMFHLILLSEYLTDDEIERILPSLKESEKPILQQVDYPAEDLPEKAWRGEHGVHVVEVNVSPRNFKQSIETLLTTIDAHQLEQLPPLDVPQTPKNSASLLLQLSFTSLERKVLYVLYKANGKLVTKEVLCEEVWHQPLTKSRVVQIYTIIGRIKDKLQVLNPDITFIRSQRSEGYFLAPIFYEKYTLESPQPEIKPAPIENGLKGEESSLVG